MKLEGIKLSVNFTTLKEFFGRKKKGKKKLQVEDRFELFGHRYRVYDADDDTFKAIIIDNEHGMAQ